MRCRHFVLCFVLAFPLGVRATQTSLAGRTSKIRPDEYSKLCAAVKLVGQNGSFHRRSLTQFKVSLKYLQKYSSLFTFSSRDTVELSNLGHEAFERLRLSEGRQELAFKYDPQLVRLFGLHERKLEPGKHRDFLGLLLEVIATLGRSGGRAPRTQLLQGTLRNHNQLELLLRATHLLKTNAASLRRGHMIELTESGQRFHEHVWGKVPEIAQVKQPKGNRDLYHVAVDAVRAIAKGEVQQMFGLSLLTSATQRRALEQLGLFERPRWGRLVLSDKGRKAWELIQGLSADEYDPGLIVLLGLDELGFPPGKNRDALATLLDVLAPLVSAGGELPFRKLSRAATVESAVLERLVRVTDLIEEYTESASGGRVIRLTEKGRAFHDTLGSAHEATHALSLE